MGPSKQVKQIIQTEHNIVKNPKRELWATEKQIQVVVNQGPPDCESDPSPGSQCILMYVDAWHKATNAFVEKYILISWILAYSEVEILGKVLM